MPDDTSNPWLVPSTSPELKRYESFSDVWHYTSEAGLAGMVRTNTIWASSHRSLNDTSEIAFAIGAVQSAWDEAKSRLVDDAPDYEVTDWLDAMADSAKELEFYFVSATSDGDSLGHWQYYGNGDGIAVRFDPSVEFRVVVESGTPRLFQPDFIPSLYWRTVQYGSFDFGFTERVDNRIWGTLTAALDAFGAFRAGRVAKERAMLDHLQRIYLTTIAFVKHGGFEHENEIRLLAIAPPFQGATSARLGRYGEQTYMILSAATGDDLHYYSQGLEKPLPITHVRVSPGRDSLARKQRVGELLRTLDYKDVIVEESALPFR